MQSKFGASLLSHKTPKHLVFPSLPSMSLTNSKRSEFLFVFHVCYLTTMLVAKIT